MMYIFPAATVPNRNSFCNNTTKYIYLFDDPMNYTNLFKGLFGLHFLLLGVNVLQQITNFVQKTY